MTWYLETERLKLRAIDSTDARNLYELNADPRVMEFLSPEYDSLEEAEAILPKVVARNERYGNQLGLFAAIEKGSEEFIGTFILRPDRHAPDGTKNLEIGYRLKQRWWGKGLGTEGSLALVERALAQFGARRIYANAMPGNRASIRIMEKIGLGFEKAYTETDDCGKTVELVMYSREYPSGPQSRAARPLLKREALLLVSKQDCKARPKGHPCGGAVSPESHEVKV